MIVNLTDAYSCMKSVYFITSDTSFPNIQEDTDIKFFILHSCPFFVATDRSAASYFLVCPTTVKSCIQIVEHKHALPYAFGRYADHPSLIVSILYSPLLFRLAFPLYRFVPITFISITEFKTYSSLSFTF